MASKTVEPRVMVQVSIGCGIWVNATRRSSRGILVNATGGFRLRNFGQCDREIRSRDLGRREKETRSRNDEKGSCKKRGNLEFQRQNPGSTVRTEPVVSRVGAASIKYFQKQNFELKTVARVVVS